MTNKIPTGRFVWFEYSSKDLPKSQGFFGELFNWSTQSVPMEKGAYTMIASGDATIGGYAMPTSMKGAPDAWWLSHLQVADAAASAKQVAKLGGKVLQDPPCATLRARCRDRERPPCSGTGDVRDLLSEGHRFRSRLR